MEELAMTGHPAELHGGDKIGAYLGCDPTLLDQALAWQQQWAARGLHKRLGELLLELQLMSGDLLWAALRAQRLDRLRSKQAEGAAGIEIRFPSTAGLAGYVVRTGQVLHVRDVYADPRFNPAFDRDDWLSDAEYALCASAQSCRHNHRRDPGDE